MTPLPLRFHRIAYRSSDAALSDEGKLNWTLVGRPRYRLGSAVTPLSEEPPRAMIRSWNLM